MAYRTATIAGWPTEWDAEVDYQDPAPPEPADWVEVLELLGQRIADTDVWVERVRAGELSYPDYLLSPWWQEVRWQRLVYAGWRCEWHNWRTGARCKATRALDVHHLTYARLGAEDWEEDLIVLCRTHHYGVHRREE